MKSEGFTLNTRILAYYGCILHNTRIVHVLSTYYDVLRCIAIVEMYCCGIHVYLSVLTVYYDVFS